MDYKEVFGEELGTQIEGIVEEKKINLIVDDKEKPSYIPKTRFDEVIGSKNELKSQVGALSNELESLKKSAKGNEELTTAITELQNKNNDWENKYNNVKNEIRQVFLQRLPDQTNIVDELAQMDEKLQAMRKEYAGLQPCGISTLDPLSVLHHITANTPENLNVEIDSISVTNSSAHITAVCNSFEDAYKWEKLLQSVQPFKSVHLQSPRKQPDSNLVEFTVFIAFIMD